MSLAPALFSTHPLSAGSANRTTATAARNTADHKPRDRPNVIAMQTGERITAFHFTDPGCPWAYSARPAHARLVVALRRPDRMAARDDRPQRDGGALRGPRLHAGARGRELATGSRRASECRSPLEHKPRMAATSRACRAIVAAREIDPALGERALRELQLLQFTTPRLLDEDGDLRDALGPGARPRRGRTVAKHRRPRDRGRVRGRPSLARSAEGSPTHAQDRSSTSDGPVRFTAPSVIFERPDGPGWRSAASSRSRPTTRRSPTSTSRSTGDRRRPTPSRPGRVPRRPHHRRGGRRSATVRPRGRRPGRDRGAAHRARGERHRTRDPVGGDAVWRVGSPPG